MSLEIRTKAITQARKSFGNIQRRLGDSKTPTRYEEVSYDLQPTANFHYKPLWRPEYELYDYDLTKIKMGDWDALRDVRQFYYATYNISRAAMMETAQKNLKMADELNLFDTIPQTWRDIFVKCVGPMRHFEWGANMNNYQICADGYGVAITAPAGFCAHDRLGMAQLITQLLLTLDPSGENLDQCKEEWLENEAWQGIRKCLEDSFVVTDWFELFVAQNLVMDSLVHPLVFDAIDEAGRTKGGQGMSIVTQFMRDWRQDHNRWVDGVLKAAASESEDNAQQLRAWVADWTARIEQAVKPLAQYALGDTAAAITATHSEALKTRLKKIKLEA